MIRVLFVCVHNASRSQMGEAFFNALAPAGMRAASAGTTPGPGVSVLAVEAMAEVGIDMKAARPKEIADAGEGPWDKVITMGCGVDAACPVMRGVKVNEDWALADPKGRPIEEVRPIRDEIRRRVVDLIARLGGTAGAL